MFQPSKNVSMHPERCVEYVAERGGKKQTILILQSEVKMKWSNDCSAIWTTISSTFDTEINSGHSNKYLKNIFNMSPWSLRRPHTSKCSHFPGQAYTHTITSTHTHSTPPEQLTATSGPLWKECVCVCLY